MTEKQIRDVCTWHFQGAKIMVKAHYSGRRRLKVMRGPFGLISRRFHCEDSDIRRLKACIREARVLN